MSKSAHPIDNINIESPCTADWDSMVGNDVVRFCHHCNLNVHDLTLMTQREALALVRSSNGRLCLRFIRRPDGTIQTAPPHQKLHVLKRRASRLAASAFGATLSLCSTVPAQTPSLSSAPAAAYESSEVSYKLDNPSPSAEGGIAALIGTVSDPNQAVIPGAKVKLTNESTKYEMESETNDEGQYRFDSLDGGSYTLVVQSSGFVRQEIRELNVPQSGEQRLDISLEVAAMSGGAVVVMEPSEPLLRAVVNNDMAEVKALLAARADVNVIDKNYNSTALAEAVAQGNKELVQILIRAGADVNLKNKKAQTAIMNLGYESTGEIIRELIDAGARVNDKDEDGNTPLLNAAIMNNPKLVQALLDAGANVNEQNEAGQTALMLAAREGYIENVKALIAALADINRTDDDDWTALRYAREGSHDDVIELLKSYGAIER